ncbi:MAG: hypothetical protein J0I80_00920 [Sphingomonas sp.]|nr:hypothetical protein [Sphingomonas sp.]
MIRVLSLAIAAALLASAAAGDAQPRGRRGPAGPDMPNPSAVVAAELGFARLAQEKGQWTAFRETADKDAVMFVPDAVNAQSWLKKRADPPKALAWQPYRVVVSCDGGYALSTGPWTGPNGQSGTFNTIWRRQSDGSFKWILDFGSDAKTPRQEDPIIDGKVAQCGRGRAMMGPDRDGPSAGERRRDRKADEKAREKAELIPNPPPLSGEGRSADGSLRWRWIKGATENSFEVTTREGDSERTVTRVVVPVAAR